MRVEINGVLYAPVRKPARHLKPLPTLLKGIRELRQESLDEAADGIGISKSHLWGLEQGKNQPKLDVLQALLNYYGIEFSEIG